MLNDVCVMILIIEMYYIILNKSFLTRIPFKGSKLNNIW